MILLGRRLAKSSPNILPMLGRYYFLKTRAEKFTSMFYCGSTSPLHGTIIYVAVIATLTCSN